MIDLETFKKKYISFDFDELLFAQNNVLVNDDKLYLSVKKLYFDKTLQNLQTLQELFQQLNELLYNQNGIIMFGIEETQKKLKQSIKTIIINQQHEFKTFTDHIIFLNRLNSTQQK